MSTSLFDLAVAQGEDLHDKWKAGMLCRDLIPAADQHDFAVASLYVSGSLAAGFIETKSNILENAARIYNSLIHKAETAGFVDADVLMMYFKRERWTPCATAIAGDMITALGGPVAFMDLFDLVTMDADQMGAA